jgi:Zn ribbon nucleic-acid-binding protein
MKTYQYLANKIGSMKRCEKQNNVEWYDRHREDLLECVNRYLPSGSGFDAGTSIDIHKSSEERLVFETAFHHMNGDGFYDGWSNHSVVVKADLACGFALRITGKDLNRIKDVIADVFYDALNMEIEG